MDVGCPFESQSLIEAPRSVDIGVSVYNT